MDTVDTNTIIILNCYVLAVILNHNKYNFGHASFFEKCVILKQLLSFPQIKLHLNSSINGRVKYTISKMCINVSIPYKA